VLLLRRSILTEKVARRGFHVARVYSVDPLSFTRVSEVMDPMPPVIPATMKLSKLSELSDRIAVHDPQVTRRQALLLEDEQGKLVGIVTRGDLLRAIERGADGQATVLDAGTPNPMVTFPDEVVQEAAAKMVRNNLGRLPVVSRREPGRAIGYLGRSSVMAARLRFLEEEHVRERGMGERRPRMAASGGKPGH
jgi:CBS domain-containing protein